MKCIFLITVYNKLIFIYNIQNQYGVVKMHTIVKIIILL